MELLRVSENKIKIILTRGECDELGVFDADDESEVEKKVFSILKKSEDSLPSGDLKIRILPRLSGGMEITVERETAWREIHTFVFDPPSLEKALCALKNTDFQKNSTLYKTIKSGRLIWEILAPSEDAVVSRLEDFSQRVELSCRRDFLSTCAQRIPFPTKLTPTTEEENDKGNRTFKDT